ncbi:DUF541 domain-containing protein [Candidatus Parcubacteria bacterium]|nr:MAG: DUF541 domain-containing protein [Candidatus Parcubacteria bacterium]
MPPFDRSLISGALIVLVILMVVLTFGQVQKLRLGEPPSNLKTVVVQGEGKITFVPNIAQTSFSVVSEGLTPKIVQDANASKINKVIAFLKSNGVEDKDIQTSGYYLSPRYFYPNDRGGTPYIDGYTLTQTLAVKVRDINKTGQIISGVVEAGVNQTGGLNFTLDDEMLEKVRQDARIKAFSDAKEKARAMSQAVGVRLGPIVSFSESFWGAPVPFLAEAAFGKGGGGGGVAPNIEPGSQEIAVSVSITYEIR